MARIQIPLYEVFSSKTEAESTATQMQKTIITALASRYVYIKNAGDIVENGKRVGTYCELSNGESFKVYDWQSSNAPKIMSVLDTITGLYYWTFQQSGKEMEWLRDADGNKIRSVGDTIPPPKVNKWMITATCWTIEYEGNYHQHQSSSNLYELCFFHFRNVDNSVRTLCYLRLGTSLNTICPRVSISIETSISMAVKSVTSISILYMVPTIPMLGSIHYGGGFEATSRNTGSCRDKISRRFIPEQGRIMAILL